MDPTILVALVSGVALVVSALVTLLGVRYTQRQARAAADATARLEANKVDARAYESARETWAEHVVHLREQVAELRGRIDELEQGRVRDRTRIRELEEGRIRDEARIGDLTRYARILLRILGEHHIAYPPPPPGLGS